VTGRLLTNVRIAVIVACAVGLAQCVLETLTVATLYSDLLLTPSTFFNTRMYDAYAKTYAWLAAPFGMPPIHNVFLGQGFVQKLAITPELLAVNLAVAVPLGILIGIVVTPLTSQETTTRGLAVRTVLAIAALSVLVHLVDWVVAVKLPVDPGLKEIARNLARNFLFDGTVIAVGVAIAGVPVAIVLAMMFAARNSMAVVAGVLGICAGAWLAARSPVVHASAPQAPTAAGAAIATDYNVVLISIDSLRADHLSAYGYERDTSPTMRALAADGVLFRNASSTTAWTLPGHMSMLTGRSLLGHGVVSDDRMLTDDVATLAESFQREGYSTGAIVSAPYVEARYGFGRGFDHYDDRTIHFATHGASYKEVTAPLLQQTAATWLADNADRRFFLFLHYWDVHYDYKPGPPYDTMFDPDYDGDIDGENFYFNPEVNAHMDERDLEHLFALYDGEIRLVDDHLGKLRATLTELGVAGHTIIVVTSDHGDEFFEHGRKGHHRSLYDEILRVPMILYVPGAAATRPVVEMETSIIDIAPTVLSLTGIDVPAGIEGVDLAPVAYGDRPEWDRATLAELYRLNTLNVQASLRRNGTKVIHHFNRRILEGYDLAIDPGEQDVSSLTALERGSLVRDMRDELNDLWPVYYGRIHSDGVKELSMDDATEKRLQALGYLE